MAEKTRELDTPAKLRPLLEVSMDAAIAAVLSQLDVFFFTFKEILIEQHVLLVTNLIGLFSIHFSYICGYMR